MNNSLSKIRVIILVGLQLTRKAQAVEVAKKSGYRIWSTGSKVREFCIEKYKEVSFENMVKTMRLIEEIDILKSLIEDMKRNPDITFNTGIVIDTVKSPEALKYLRGHFDKIWVIGFLASIEFRFTHSLLRKRNDDPKSLCEFNARDKRELEAGIATLIVLADYFVLAGTISESRKQFSEILNKIE